MWAPAAGAPSRVQRGQSCKAERAERSGGVLRCGLHVLLWGQGRAGKLSAERARAAGRGGAAHCQLGTPCRAADALRAVPAEAML